MRQKDNLNTVTEGTISKVIQEYQKEDQRCHKYRIQLKPGISNVNLFACVILYFFTASLYLLQVHFSSPSA